MPTLTYRKSCLLKGHSDSIVAMDFSPSGSMLTTADIDGKLFIWSRNTGKLLYETVVSQKGGFTSTAWLKNDAILAGGRVALLKAVSLTKTLLSNGQNNRDVTWLPLFDHEVECIATHRNGLIAASALDKILIFNIVTKGTMRSCKMKNELVHKNMDSKLPENVIVSSIHWANSISPHALLATYLDHGIILWDTDSGSKLRNISILARAGDATLSPDHRFVALSNLETGFDVYECDTFKAVKTLDCELSVKKQRTCLPIKFIRGGEFLLGGSSFGRPAVYRLDMEGPVELLIHEVNCGHESSSFSAYQTKPGATMLLLLADTTSRGSSLLDLVLRHADAPSLACLMRVSGLLFELAGGHLWHTIATSFYVLKLLPSFRLVNGLWTFDLKYPAPSTEWTRFDQYAPAIRIIRNLISTAASDILDIDPRVFLFINRARPSKLVLFENLELLLMPAVIRAPFRIDYLGSTKLREIHLESCYLLDHYLDDLLPSARQLEILSLKGPMTGDMLLRLSSVQTLKALYLELETPLYDIYLADYKDYISFLQLVNGMPHLACLDINIPFRLIQAPLSCNAFTGIKHLELQADIVSLANVLLPGCFISVTLRFGQKETAAGYRTCFEALSKGSKLQLESVCIRTLAVAEHDFPFMLCLEPLLHAKHIKKLFVSSCGVLNIPFTDEDLRQMATSWRNIESFTLLSSPDSPAGRDPKAQPALQSVYSWMAQNPQLINLAIRAGNRSIIVS
ncbi:hypothetical protein NLJ89_g9454 [Agrocybe chaxingu]|uniref:Uncharacterized protein n=1 Tax=Agrocybe chaxingu TaxID=84603 RepID=A0A9W8JTC4_9AGAR|nr:hypothetical protein NLJ89_g9454 [Agrocybe chaxingu]